MAIALDLAAAAMANGKTGADLDREGQGSCTGCCQIFIAYDPYLFGEEEEIQAKFDDRVAAADATTPEKEGRAMSPARASAPLLPVPATWLRVLLWMSRSGSSAWIWLPARWTPRTSPAPASWTT